MVPCGSIDQTKEILSNPVFFAHNTLVLHFRVNDSETMLPQESCQNMHDMLLYAKKKVFTLF